LSYVLATTGSKVKWYKFKTSHHMEEGDYELLGELDLEQVPLFGDKSSAKSAALALGIKTWRYVKI